MRARVPLLTLVALAPTVAVAGPFDSAVVADVIDQSATVEWVDGHETSRASFLAPVNQLRWKNQVTWFVTVPGAITGPSGIAFGASTRAGPRHLRVGFKRAVSVGTVLTRGDVDRVSVLRADAAYPGDVGRDADWLEATRGAGAELSLWVLPPGTTTRAVRFTAVCGASSEPSAPMLRGASLFAARLANLAPAATALASSHPGAAARLVDGSFNEWSPPWDDDDGARAEPLSPARPEWVMLVWPRRVSLRGLGVFFPFVGKAEVQVYTGPDALHPREADEKRWRTLATPSFPNTYPTTLAPVWIDFTRTVATRAVRLRLVAPVADEGPRFPGASRGGKRAWLGELMAVQALGDAPPPAARPPAEPPRHPPLAVPFTMPEAGYATLVIEDANGQRVRNLVADAWFGAGPQVAWWDGLDESGRLEGPHFGAGGAYTVVGAPVAPGTYGVRGLFHGPLALTYELSVYSPGSPPWMTGARPEAGAGGWLSDHASPTAALSLPARGPGTAPRMLLASPLAEAGHGLVWTDLAGRKLDGRRWVGGTWTGASHLARDDGAHAVPGVSAYAGVSWEGKLRLTALRDRGEPTLVGADALAPIAAPVIGGLAARDGVVFASLPKSDGLVRVDAASGAVLGQSPLPDGRGLAFDARGRLLALSGRRLLAFTAVAPPALAEARVLVDGGLEDPRAVTTDARGDIYVADWGTSHQVKVFDADGRPLRVEGRPGGAVAGPYDPRRMNRPAGLAVAEDGRLWVAEDSWAPKRVSVWTKEGALATAFYGPPQYGGGGALDPRDRTRFYYAGQGQGTGLEFAVDWATGASSLRSIYWLAAPDPSAPPGDTGPQTPIYVDGRQYMTDVFNARPVGGPWIANLWLMRGARAVRVASFGPAGGWPLLQTAPFRARWPAKDDGTKPPAALIYAWSDLDGDGRAEPDEVTIAPGLTTGATFNDRLELCTSSATVWAPEGFTAAGVPRYDARHARPQAGSFVMREVASGSGTVMALGDGWTISAGGPVRGFRGGVQRWTYPNEWPSQQAGVTSRRPTHPGELMATTRIMGPALRPVAGKVGDVGEVVAINGDKGVVFLMTADGLFVSTLFHDVRLATATWDMPEATRGMRLDDVSVGEEAFWTNVAQMSDGSVALVAGKNHSSVVRVDGLANLRPLAAPALKVTEAALAEARVFREASELDRQRHVGRDLMTVPLGATGITIDGDLGDWAEAARHTSWVTIDEPDGPMGRVEAAAAVVGARLCLAFRTSDASLLANGGESWRMSFATGGALDLMLGVDPGASPGRADPAPGDLRLVVTRASGKTRAVLYRPSVQGARGRPVPFSSPWRTVTMDEVTDVSDVVELAQKGGAYEVSVPLATLGLRPKDGLELRGDVGVLRGDGARTLQRLYWQNKIAGPVSDIPTEASLRPALWGRLRFVAPPRAGQKRGMLAP